MNDNRVRGEAPQHGWKFLRVVFRPDHPDMPAVALIQGGCESERHLAVDGIVRFREKEELIHG